MKETEKLELKQLTSYLPNGLWWYDPETETQWSTMSISSTGSIVIQRCDEITTPETPVRKCIFVNATFGFKLILRSLSDLTKEIDIVGEKFVPANVINDEYPGEAIGLNPATWTHRVVEKLFEWHFDIYGLVEKGLAYDINKLPSNKQTPINSEN